MAVKRKVTESKPTLKRKPSKKQSASPKENTFREVPRIRSFKPELFVHVGLFEAEREYGLPLWQAFAGLILCADREGRFRWQPRRLKLYTIPYHAVDMEKVMDALAEKRFIQKYPYQGQWYGVIPGFLRHQKITSPEPPSIFPNPEEVLQEVEARAPVATVREQNSVNETQNDLYFSNSIEQNLAETNETENKNPENLHLTKGVLDQNFQKNIISVSETDQGKSSIEAAFFPALSENTNKNNGIEGDIEFSRHPRKSFHFEEKNFILKNAQGKEGIGKDGIGRDGSGEDLIGTDGEGKCATACVESLIRPRVFINDLQFVFEHWKQVMHHPNARLDPKRKKLITKALKLGYTTEELCQAISGCSLTPHNIGDNELGQRFDGLQVILRDADQIDRFMRNYHSPPRRLNEAERQAAANVQVLQTWMEEEETGCAAL